MRGLSQRALGDALGLGKQVGSTRINRYERRAAACDMDTAARIAAELQVPLAYLFADTDELAEAILAFSRLSGLERKRLLAAMKSKAK